MARLLLRLQHHDGKCEPDLWIRASELVAQIQDFPWAREAAEFSQGKRREPSFASVYAERETSKASILISEPSRNLMAEATEDPGYQVIIMLMANPARIARIKRAFGIVADFQYWVPTVEVACELAAEFVGIDEGELEEELKGERFRQYRL